VTTFAAENRLAEFIGVPRTWLAPVAAHLKQIEEKLEDKTLSDADLQSFLVRANARLPELFAKMDVDALAEALEAGMGAAAMDGLRQGLRQD
jgi:hypothetical protein